jgi:hypothetical protein
VPADSERRHRYDASSVNRALTGVGLAIILLLILLDASAAFLRLTATSRAFPPAAWDVTPPQWVD